MSNDEKRDRVINVRVDCLTQDEQMRLSSEIKKAKNTIAPDSRGTIVEGDMKSLPSQVPLPIEGEER
ncbi:MAG: hypothetical protein F6J87_07980 [Spirulina sp. SIO3F2]|nr:hypothetical protein [Spirulina sp. SIO3F2]